jgi:pSer/pThr/pTyr-binding forkhead associated (FHA) protein
MDARLILRKGKNEQAIRLRQPETIIGRRHDATLRIPSAEVSRHHCRIIMHPDGYLTVEDLNSANGTLVNGTAVSGREVLRPGDHLQVGPVTFLVEYQLTQQAIDRLLEGVEEEGVVDAVPASAEFSQAELPQAELIDEEGVTEEARAGEGVEDFQLEEIETSAEALAALDETDDWNPSDQEFRDLLTNLEEPEEPPRKRKRS